MSDTGVYPVEKLGALIRGTFFPGRHDIEFRWQLPYSGGKEIQFTETLPPHVAEARVIAAASQQMRLVAEDFPEAEPRLDQGQHLLVTVKQLRREDPPFTRLHVELHDIPTAGPAHLVATFISGAGILFGIGFAFASRRGQPKRATRTKAEGKA